MIFYYQNNIREVVDPMLIAVALRKGWKELPPSPECNENEIVSWNYEKECWDIIIKELVDDNLEIELSRGFHVLPENFRLAMQESDRNQWTALRSQILDGLSMEKLTMDTPLIIWDIDHKPREVIVRRLREILFDSGIWYMQLKAKYSNLG